MTNEFFNQQWNEIASGKKAAELSIFVPKREFPRTQKQFFSYCYYQLVNRLIAGRDYKNSVEFGCGRGTLSLYLNLYNNIETTLLDISEGALGIARANFELYGGEGNFLAADGTSVPIPSNSYDLVVSLGLLEHLPNYIDSLREMYRVCKPGGMLISMNVPEKKSIQVLNDLYLVALRVIGKYKLKPLGSLFRTNDKPEKFLENAETAGFKNCSIVHTNPFPRFSPLPKKIEYPLTFLYRTILGFRKLYRKEPLATGRVLSQCHFLVGFK